MKPVDVELPDLEFYSPSEGSVSLSSLQGDHDREVLAPLEAALEPAVPVISWKALLDRGGGPSGPLGGEHS